MYVALFFPLAILSMFWGYHIYASANAAIHCMLLSNIMGQIDFQSGLASQSYYESAEIVDSYALMEQMLFFTSAACMAIWMILCQRNARLFGHQGMKYGAGWAVFGFIVPILNLVRPLQVVEEIYATSHPNALPANEEEGSLWKSIHASRMVFIWWVVWLLFIFSRIFRLFHNPSPEVISEVQTSIQAQGVSALLDTLRLLFTFYIVFMIALLQHKSSALQQSRVLEENELIS